MKLVVVSHACVLQANRGVYRALARGGVDVTIVSPDHAISDGVRVDCEPPRDDDPPLHRLPLRGTNPRIYRFDGLMRTIESLRPDAIYLENDPLSLMSIQLGLWCRARRRRLICLSCENLDFGLRETMRRRGAGRGAVLALSKLALLVAARPNVAHVLAINRDGDALFKKYGFRSVSQTPLGFDPQLFTPDQKSRAEIRHALGWDGMIVAYFGRLVPEKGAHLLVEALGELIDLDWRFMLDRFSPQSNAYPRRIQSLLRSSGIEGRVLHIDASHHEVGKYMGAADIVVVPSLSTQRWREQYGRVAVEAMACGTLVIAADSGALPDLVVDGGLLFKEGRVDDLARLLREAVEFPGRFDDQRRTGVERAHRQLSIESQAAEIRRVLDWRHAASRPTRGL